MSNRRDHDEGATVHELKIEPQFFEAVREGVKTFEVRRMDRTYYTGDVLRLKEWERFCYTGRTIDVRVTYILCGGCGFLGIDPGYAVLGIEPVKETPRPDAPTEAIAALTKERDELRRIVQGYDLARPLISSLARRAAITARSSAKDLQEWAEAAASRAAELEDQAKRAEEPMPIGPMPAGAAAGVREAALRRALENLILVQEANCPCAACRAARSALAVPPSAAAVEASAYFKAAAIAAWVRRDGPAWYTGSGWDDFTAEELAAVDALAKEGAP